MFALPEFRGKDFDEVYQEAVHAFVDKKFGAGGTFDRSGSLCVR